MSGRAETEMQIQIMTHGEAFCPSTMTKEILSKNQKRMMVTEMQKGPTEENEIKEGQEKVEEELGNEKKESTFSSPWKFCRNLLNEERGQMDKNKIKEGQEEEQEEEGNKSALKRLHLILKRLIDFDMGIDRFARCFLERKTKLDKILENWLKTEGKSADAVDFLRNYQPLPPKEAMSKKKRNMKHHGMLPMSVQTGRYVVQGGAQKERGKLIENPELSGKFDDAEQDIQELEQLLRCKVCLDSDACIVFLPCRHMATCEYCEGFLHHCPVCRSFIEEALKINEE